MSPFFATHHRKESMILPHPEKKSTWENANKNSHLCEDGDKIIEQFYDISYRKTRIISARKCTKDTIWRNL